MSIFGDLDINSVADDPFWTAPNTYFATCTDAKIREDKEKGTRALTITWTINEPDNEFHGNNVSEYYSLPVPGQTRENIDVNTLRSIKFLKARLRNAFDLTPEEIANLEPSVHLIGKEAYITTKEGTAKDGSGRTFTNVGNAISKRQYEEENAAGASSAGGASLGL